MGLCLAHALTLASIPFTILERRTHAQLLGDDADQGASLVLSAASMRVMRQSGILDSLLPPGPLDAAEEQAGWGNKRRRA